jgi:hypothetical protein
MDVFNFPNTQNNNFVFYANGGTTSWQTWTKPRNVKFVSIFAISGGGGGGNGRSSATIINSTGGGGGASSGTALGIFSANSLPDTLYIQVGLGGAAVSPGTATYVSAQPNSTPINVIIGGGGGGGTGANGAGGGGGGAVGIAFRKTTDGLLGASGIITSTTGWAGGAGGAATSGTTIQVSGVTTGGAGGGANNASSINAVGGNINGIGIVPTITGGVIDGGGGDMGYKSLLPFVSSSVSVPMFFTGGAGGGSKYNGVGGTGGNGGFGSGGGGGGSGLNVGPGGKGGDGLVIITCW